MSHELEIAGAIVASLAAAAGVLAPARRTRAICMLLALGLGVALLLGDSWNDSRVVDLREETARLAVAAVAGAAMLALLAVAMRRWRAAFPLLAVAALPFRVPIDIGGESANLLLPLYAVIAAALLAELIDVWQARGLTPKPQASEPSSRSQGGLTPQGPSSWPALAARWLAPALVAAVVLYAVQLSYADDPSQGLQNICFFYLPFSVLFSMLVRIEWSARWLRSAFAVLVIEALLFAIVAGYQYAAEDLLWNPDVMAANLFHPYFRVNSLFWDPNILGRYLAVAIAVLASLMLMTRSARTAWACLVASLLLLTAMSLTFSQSAFLALLAGLIVLAALRWSARWTLVLGGSAAVVAMVFVLAGGVSLDFDFSGKSLDGETSGRGELIRGGVELGERSPALGLGSGSFSQEFQERYGDEQAAASASHTEPVTIFAEQGAIGLIVYGALIATAIAALLAGLGPCAPGLRGFAAAPGLSPPRDASVFSAVAAARAAALTGFIVMFVHSLSYAAFLTDPITWALLALGLGLIRHPPGVEAPQMTRGGRTS